MDASLSIEEAARQLGGSSKCTLHAWLSKARLQRTTVGGRTMVARRAIETDGVAYREPLRLVRLRAPLLLQCFPVTNALFAEFNSTQAGGLAYAPNAGYFGRQLALRLH